MKWLLVLILCISTIFCSKISNDVLRTLSLNNNKANIAIELKDQVDINLINTMNIHVDAKAHILVEMMRSIARKTQYPITRLLEKERMKYNSIWIANMIFVKDASSELIEKLAQRDDVSAIYSNEEGDGGVETNGVEDNEAKGIEWNVQFINADKVWSMGYKGEGIVVAGVDTGIIVQHEALIQKYRGYQNGKLVHDYNWWDGVREPGQMKPAPIDDSGHGTHTVGTAVGGTAANQIGMAPNAQFIGCRTMLSGRNSLERAMSCLQFVMAPTTINGTNPDPSKRPHVTINSWRCSTCAQNALKKGFEALRASGILASVSAGNYGPGCSSIQQPGYLESVFTIAASEKESHKLASFSSRGPITFEGGKRPKPDITAPGVNVRSSTGTNSYTVMSGTSMSAPAVAGAVALLWSAQPKLARDIDATIKLLQSTAVPQPSNECSSNGVPNNLYGWGGIDIHAAVKKALEY
jgi:serine protease AprX